MGLGHSRTGRCVDKGADERSVRWLKLGIDWLAAFFGVERVTVVLAQVVWSRRRILGILGEGLGQVLLDQAPDVGGAAKRDAAIGVLFHVHADEQVDGLLARELEARLQLFKVVVDGGALRVVTRKTVVDVKAAVVLQVGRVRRRRWRPIVLFDLVAKRNFRVRLTRLAARSASSYAIWLTRRRRRRRRWSRRRRRR